MSLLAPRRQVLIEPFFPLACCYQHLAVHHHLLDAGCRGRWLLVVVSLYETA